MITITKNKLSANKTRCARKQLSNEVRLLKGEKNDVLLEIPFDTIFIPIV